jgi:hypothetical protein
MPVTINGTTGVVTPGATIGSINGILKSTAGVVSEAVSGTDFSSGIQGAKAWVNFNGTTSPGTIRSSYNVSSVTKNGTGDYTVNFATALADANYSVVGISTQDTATGRAITVNEPNPSVRSTSSIRFYVTYYEATRYDSSSISLIFFVN